MANLLYVYCSDCEYRCAACHLTPNILRSMKQENEEIFNSLMALTAIFVFCQEKEDFIVLELLG